MPTLLSFAQEATGVGEEGENKEVRGGHPGDSSSGSTDNKILEESGHSSSDQQQPQQELSMPERQAATPSLHPIYPGSNAGVGIHFPRDSLPQLASKEGSCKMGGCPGS